MKSRFSFTEDRAKELGDKLISNYVKEAIQLKVKSLREQELEVQGRIARKLLSVFGYPYDYSKNTYEQSNRVEFCVRDVLVAFTEIRFDDCSVNLIYGLMSDEQLYSLCCEFEGEQYVRNW